MYQIFNIHLSVEECLGGFHSLFIVNKEIIRGVGCQVLCVYAREWYKRVI